jgi:very-short-patch-repair endonuclease
MIEAMSADERALRAKHGDPLRIWRIVRVRGANSAEDPTGRRIWRDLHVPDGLAGDPGLAVIATAQDGVVHRAQLTGLGFGRGAVAHRVATGRLHRRFPSVYAVGHQAVPVRGQLIAALLQGGADCVLSNHAAAYLWGLVSRAPMERELAITVAGRRMRTPSGLCVYRVPILDSRDVRIRYGLPVTAPARTLLDFAAGDSDDATCAEALAVARRTGLVSDAEIDDVLDRHPRRSGRARLRELQAAEQGAVITRSEAERCVRRLLAQADLPAPEVNTMVAGLEVDFLWRRERLIVEADGYRYHSGRHRWEQDHLRDPRLLAAGYRVLRVTWRQLVATPIAVAVRIGQALTTGQGGALTSPDLCADRPRPVR